MPQSRSLVPADLRPHVRRLIVAVVLFISVAASGQAPALTIISAGPTGELDHLSDADEVRIVFSEPMVPIGEVPTGVAPPWIRIMPAAPGHFYWSGTRTLIFSPDVATPLPYDTPFTVRVDASAASVAGRTLTAPYEFTFMTPRVRIRAVEWYRKTGRFDSPAVISLLLNQPKRGEEIIDRIRVSLTPHEWKAPELSADARAWLRRHDPTGLQKFDEKVAAVHRLTSMSDPIEIRLATSWDEERFTPSPDRIVVETTSVPPPDAWLTIDIQDDATRRDSETAAARSRLVKLDPAFFVTGTKCESECDPAPMRGNSISLRRQVSYESLARALTIVDVTSPGDERPVGGRDLDIGSHVAWVGALDQLGFPRQPPASRWRLRIAAYLEAADGQTLGYPWVGFIENLHAEPFVAFDGSVWESAGGPSLPVTARNVASMAHRLEPVSRDALLPVFRDVAQRWGPAFIPEGEGEIRRVILSPDRIQVHTLDIRRLLSRAGTGLLGASIAPEDTLPGSMALAPDATKHAVIQVTNLGITVKESPTSMLVFVTRLDTGEPVPDARVSILTEWSGIAWTGTTDRDGIAVAPHTPSVLVTAAKDGDFAFVHAAWLIHSSSYSWGSRLPTLRGSVITDRGVYKQSEEVRLKAIVRADTLSGVQLLTEGQTLEIVVNDARGEEVDRRTVQASGWSTVEWTWQVPPRASLGGYHVEVRAGESAGLPESHVQGKFVVAAFRRPDFRVDATLTAEPAILGSTLRATVDARYLFGSAVGGRPARWRSYRIPVHQPPSSIRDRFPEERYAVGYAPNEDGQDSDDEPTNGVETLGDDGRAIVALPSEAGFDYACSYRFMVEVASVSGQHIADRKEIVVHPASLYVAMSRPPFFVQTNAGTQVEITAVDLSGHAVTDVPITVSLVKEDWVRMRSVSPRAFGYWERRETPAGEWTVRTRGVERPVRIEVKEAGSYILRATARDESGRPTRTESRFYALGDNVSFWRSDGNTIELTPERAIWKPGETARILVQSPWPSATALVTTEREGIRTHRRIAIESTQDTIDVPITGADFPNVFVGVLLVKGRTSTNFDEEGNDVGRPDYRVGEVELTVDDPSKRLNVEVSTDRAEYQPRQPVNVSVAVVAHDRTPASAEVTLWAVDHGVLSLTNYEVRDVVEAVYPRKESQVVTMDNRVRLMKRSPALPPSGLPAGDLVQTSASRFMLGGSTEVAVTAPPSPPAYEPVGTEVRHDFRPLVFWLGSVTTAAEGRASTTVTLPDSLTTYRIMAVASDKRSRFGHAEAEIRATKPLTLLPGFPRFMTTGDRASFGAVLTNGTGTEGTAVVTVESLDPRVLRFSGTASRTISVAPGTSERVTFDGVARESGAARVRVIARLGTESDGFELPLDVTSPLRMIVTAAYGETTSTARETLVLPPTATPSSGGLTVDLASTALVGFTESARYLQEYPYECAEQKASRALALVLAADVGGAFRLPGINEDAYRERAAKALNELYAYQCGDGFALWPGRCASTSAYLTAYVLHVLKVGERQSIPLDSGAIERAVGYLQAEVTRAEHVNDRWWPAWAVTQAYSLKVLTEFGREPTNAIDRLARAADRLPIIGLSHLADALAASGDKGPRYQGIVRRLTNALRIDADRAYVQEDEDGALGWLWHTNVTATAVVLEGFSRRNEPSPLLAPLARWLVAARKDGRWSTTHENALALEAFVSYYRHVEPEVPRMTAAVSVGSTTFGTASFEGRSTASQQIRVPLSDLARASGSGDASVLSIAREGAGRLYYTARLQYVVPESAGAVDRGFHVERRYERYGEKGERAPATTFSAGDLVRITVAVTVRGEGRYLALTDPLPAGFEPIDSLFATTAADLADATRELESGGGWSFATWRRGTFDHIERHDDRVVAFATWLGPGRHEFSYLVRATTAGTFGVAGARIEAMYAPELEGRSGAATVIVR